MKAYCNMNQLESCVMLPWIFIMILTSMSHIDTTRFYMSVYILYFIYIKINSICCIVCIFSYKYIGWTGPSSTSWLKDINTRLKWQIGQQTNKTFKSKSRKLKKNWKKKIKKIKMAY